jgi:hypothetical protein
MIIFNSKSRNYLPSTEVTLSFGCMQGGRVDVGSKSKKQHENRSLYVETMTLSFYFIPREQQ